MDQALEISEPVCLALNADGLTAISSLAPSGGNAEGFLRDQLTAGTWCYVDGKKVRLVCRTITIDIYLCRFGEDRLVLGVEAVTATTPQEVTSAFREGTKVVAAAWIVQGAGDECPPAAGPANGAAKLWSAVLGESAPPSRRMEASTLSTPSDTTLTPTQSEQFTPPPSDDTLEAPADAEFAPEPGTDPEPLDPAPIQPQPLSDQASPESTPPSDHASPESTPPSGQALPESTPPDNQSASPTGELGEEKPIMPQSEIDNLLNSLRPGNASEQQPSPLTHSQTGEPGSEQSSGMAPASPIETPVDSSLTKQPVASQNQPVPPLSSPAPLIQSGINLEEWGGGQSTRAHSVASEPSPSASPPGFPGENLVDIVKGHSYVVATFDRQDDLLRELSSLRAAGMPISLFAFWGQETLDCILAPGLADRLEKMRAKYRGAAAALESAKTKMRQSEQLLPSVQQYQVQQTASTKEKAEIQAEMERLRMKHIVANHDGQVLAAKVYLVEIRRQALMDKLAKATHQVIRKVKPGHGAKAGLRRIRKKFLVCQHQLETLFERLSVIEREAQRRLQFQSEWQALLRRQAKIQRDLDEMGRFLKAVGVDAPGAPPPNPDAIKEWMENEWKVLRDREKLLHTWLECLNDQNAWSLRKNDEKVVVLGDEGILKNDRIIRGGYLVILKKEGDPADPADVPDGCDSWLVADTTFRIIGSGRGLGQTNNPLVDLLNELAHENGITFEEALASMGLSTEDV